MKKKRFKQNHSNIIKVNTKYEIVSFDLYDTLINRLVEKTSDVFDLVSEKYYEEAGRHLSNFKEYRIRAEREARKEGKGFIDIKKIYNHIPFLSENERRKCIEIEESIEYDVAYANKIGKQYYEKLKKIAKKIIIISDMYLCEDLLRKILEKCGYTDFFNIYISGKVGCSKADGGKLFSYVCNDLAVDRKFMLHIGNNVKSDWFYSKSQGIESLLISDLSKNYNALDRYTWNRIKEIKTKEEKIGYRYLGGVLIGFIKWIHDECSKKSIRDIYFFSREGYFFKEVYDRLYRKSDECIRTHYLYVSRHSLSVPLIGEVTDYEGLKERVYICESRTTVNQFLDKLGISTNEEIRQLICSEMGQIGNIYLNNIDRKRLFAIIKDFVKHNSEEQMLFAKKYFEQAIVRPTSKIGIVDIGWTGMMQKNFEDLLHRCGLNYGIYGFFLGQKPEMMKYVSQGMKNYGYLFDYKDKKYRDKILSGCGFLEFVFHPGHGSTVGYDAEGPILNPLEIPKSSMYHIELVQKGVMLLVSQIGNICKEYNVLRNEDIKSVLVRFITRPNASILDIIGDWEMNDGEVGCIVPISKNGFNMFYRDFFKTGWHVGYLKRNIRLNLPYYEVYNLIRKIWKLIELLKI